ncbi:uncharacterized protein LOC123009881 [Tribolium madens]|uniref:uncharacterized protein LOC123009881 n=1 Tax=Tribolium madens TaxID=41895 RepID=UPI001CF7373D|nr:uncharacterized protein LOC123009881 [Tribolium madens]
MSQRQSSNQRTQLRYVGTQAPFIGTQDFQIANFALKVNINNIRRYLAHELASNKTYAIIWEVAKEIYAEDVEDGRKPKNAKSSFLEGISLQESLLLVGPIGEICEEHSKCKSRKINDL